MSANSRFDSHRLIDNRQIRIFLSSTFSDMQGERDALIKTFNSLKIEAAKRDVTLSVIDLRWGVTDEEARTGKVISVCLNEIENSHPFFIGILGNRYGTAPNRSELMNNPDLLERYNWLNDVVSDNPNEGMSITEMEIQYGVLLNDNEVDAAFFFKKSDKPDDDNRLTTLKEKVRKKYDPDYRNDYTTPGELCEKVVAEIKKIIDKHFPKKDAVTLLDRERTAQRAFINSRHRHFVGRDKDLEYLDNFVHSNHRYLVITGESGMGKSALLANWIRSNQGNDSFNLVYHFVGNSFSGNSYVSVLSHLCEEIYDIYKIERYQNHQEKLEEEAQRLLSELANKKKPLVVIIDGINQIIATKDEKLLLWLPTANDNVKFIFTTLRDDTTMQALERRGCEVRVLEALSDTQRKEFAIEYLNQVGKHIDGQLLQRIINDKESRNTLVLRTFLDELICFGSHELLAERVDYYLSANSIPDFFDKMLQRMEQDYNNGQDLVSHTLSLIALSEHGLSEDELMAITGFRQMDWHLFYCAFFNHFVEKEGLISFSHPYVANAINHRYALGDATVTVSFRQEIVAHFAKNSSDDEIQHQRCISELAHQYYNLDDWANLHNILLSFEAFDYFYENNVLLLTKYWQALVAYDNNSYDLSDYMQIADRKEAISIGMFVKDLGTIMPVFRAESLLNLGLFISEYFAKYDMAIKYLLKSIALIEKTHGIECPDIASGFGAIGMMFHHKGEYVKAMEYYLKALEINEKCLGVEHPNTAYIYGNIGSIYSHQRDDQKAEEYLFKALMIIERVFGTNHLDIAYMYNNIGAMCRNQGDYERALEYLLKALAIKEKCLGVEHKSTATSYDNVGSLYCFQGNYDKALAYNLKALEVYKKVLGEEHTDTAASYDNVGMVYCNKKDYDKALEYHFRALTIYEKILGSECPDVGIVCKGIGFVYWNQGDYDKALAYSLRALAIQEKLFGKDHPETAIQYKNISMVYWKLGDYDNAMEYYLRELEVEEKKHGKENPDIIEAYNEVAGAYNNFGNVYYNQGDYDKALGYYLKALEVEEKKQGKEKPDIIKAYNDVAEAYNSFGDVYYNQGDYEKALGYFLKALAIYEKVLGKEHSKITVLYNNIGGAYWHLGDFDKAFEYYFRALAIEEDVLGTEHLCTAATYNNIGGMYCHQGNNVKALEYLNKAYLVFEKEFGPNHPNTKKTIDWINQVKGALGII